MESPEEKGYPGWNLLKSWATSDGIHNGVIYVLLFSSGYYQMESSVQTRWATWME
jgi:hypothetical protein